MKALQKQQAALQKQVTDLKAEKDTAEKIASKLSVDAAKVKDQYAKETETYKVRIQRSLVFSLSAKYLCSLSV